MWLYSYTRAVYDTPSGDLEPGCYVIGAKGAKIGDPADKSPLTRLATPIGTKCVHVFDDGEKVVTAKEYADLALAGAKKPVR